MVNPRKWTAALLPGTSEASAAAAPWRAAARAVAAAGPVAGAVIAPRDFAAHFPGCVDYAEGAARAPEEIGCLVVHKGMMPEIAPRLLGAALWSMRPIYANEVFVVLSRRGAPEASPRHMASFYDNLAAAAAPADLSAPARAGRGPAVYLGDHVALTVTADGMKLYVDTRDVSLAPHLLLDGMWEAWITSAVKRVVKPGMRVADIGANFGYYATLMGRLVGPHGFVHCFEPSPSVFDLLSRSMEINGLHAFSKCHRLALHAEPGRRVLRVWRKHFASASFLSQAANAAAYGDELEDVEVETARLDDALGGDLRLDFIKIDAEGSEPAILAGARRVLASNRALQIAMEFAPAFYGGGEQARSILGFLRAEGFAIATIETDGRIAEVAPGAEGELLARPWSELYLRRG